MRGVMIVLNEVKRKTPRQKRYNREGMSLKDVSSKFSSVIVKVVIRKIHIYIHLISSNAFSWPQYRWQSLPTNVCAHCYSCPVHHQRLCPQLPLPPPSPAPTQ